MVKLKQFNLEELYVMDLELRLNEAVDLSKLNEYMNGCKIRNDSLFYKMSYKFRSNYLKSFRHV